MRRSYDTDLIDKQWTKISSLYPEANHRGRPRTIDFREITNAILYIVRAGCAWRLLPHDFPKWQTVYYYFRRWQKEGLWPKIHDNLRAEVRVQAGRNIEPSAAIAQRLLKADHAVLLKADRGYPIDSYRASWII